MRNWLLAAVVIAVAAGGYLSLTDSANTAVKSAGSVGIGLAKLPDARSAGAVGVGLTKLANTAN